MNEILTLAAAGVAGLLLGGFFFGGLWWTVRRGLTSRQPALWFLGSLVLRVGMVLAGFYWIARDQWQPLIPCLLGFVLARLVVIRLTRDASCREASTSPTDSLERGAP